MSVLYQPQRATSVPDIGDLSFDLDTMECFDDIDIKIEDLDTPEECYTTPFTSEEMDTSGGLAFFEFDRMRDLTLDLEAVASRGGEKRSLLLEEMDSGRDQVIRQDCMWSSVHSQSAAKFFKSEDSRRGHHTVQPTGNSSNSNSLLGLTPPTSYIHQHLLLRHQFETPLASADEEASSGDDEMMEGTGLWSNSLMDAVSRLSSVPLSTAVEPLAASRDHSYFSCSSSSSKKTFHSGSMLTPPESSEDEDSYQGFYVSRETAAELTTLAKTNRTAVSTWRDNQQQLQQSVNSILATHRCATAAPGNRSQPKFTFRINIKSTPATKKLNRLVRSRPSHSSHRKAQQNAALIRAAVDNGAATVITSSIRLEERTAEEVQQHQQQRHSHAQEPKGARDLHNHNERQRRTDLKNAFDYLKRRVPAIASSERVSKQMILDKAIDFCKSLKAKESSVRQHHKLLAERNELLRKKIQSLKLQKI
jgi:hypothetical protein